MKYILLLLIFFITLISCFPRESPEFYGGSGAKRPVIFVPFADFKPEQKRAEQLSEFIEKVSKYPVDIVICEQIEPFGNFNRGQVLNAGIWFYSKNVRVPEFIIFHDVDMIPDKTLAGEYSREKNYDRPISFVPIDENQSEAYGFELDPGGGIFGIKFEQFKKCNGYPNDFWGWGAEDNAFANRMKKNKIGFGRVKQGKILHLDIQRKNNKEKMDYLKKNKLRNMMAREQIKEDHEAWRDNGFGQIADLGLTFEPETVSDNVLRVKLKLSTINLEKVKEHNEKVYKMLEEKKQ